MDENQKVSAGQSPDSADEPIQRSPNSLTKAEIDTIIKALDRLGKQLDDFEQEMKEEIKAFGQELKEETKAFGQELKEEIKAFGQELKEELKEETKAFGQELKEEIKEDASEERASSQDLKESIKQGIREVRDLREDARSINRNMQLHLTLLGLSGNFHQATHSRPDPLESVWERSRRLYSETPRPRSFYYEP